MIVRVDRRVLAALVPEELVGAIRQDFIGVHVVGRSGTRLKGIDDELVEVPAPKDFVGRCHDGVGKLRVEATGFPVRERGSFFDPHLRNDEWHQWAELTDLEIVLRAKGLYAVQRIGRYIERSERVLLAASLRHGPLR